MRADCSLSFSLSLSLSLFLRPAASLDVCGQLMCVALWSTRSTHTHTLSSLGKQWWRRCRWRWWWRCALKCHSLDFFPSLVSSLPVMRVLLILSLCIPAMKIIKALFVTTITCTFLLHSSIQLFLSFACNARQAIHLSLRVASGYSLISLLYSPMFIWKFTRSASTSERRGGGGRRRRRRRRRAVTHGERQTGGELNHEVWKDWLCGKRVTLWLDRIEKRKWASSAHDFDATVSSSSGATWTPCSSYADAFNFFPPFLSLSCFLFLPCFCMRFVGLTKARWNGARVTRRPFTLSLKPAGKCVKKHSSRWTLISLNTQMNQLALNLLSRALLH